MRVLRLEELVHMGADIVPACHAIFLAIVYKGIGNGGSNLASCYVLLLLCTWSWKGGIQNFFDTRVVPLEFYLGIKVKSLAPLSNDHNKDRVVAR